MLAKWMQVVFSRQICGVSFFWRIKQAQADRLVIELNFGFPASVFFIYARVTRLVVASFCVLCVFGVRNRSQIAQTIVRTVFIDMIKLMFGPCSIRIQPRQSVSGVQHIVHANANVAIVHSTACRVAGSATPSSFVPSKLSRVRNVINQFAKPSLGKFFNVHDFNYIKQAGHCQA